MQEAADVKSRITSQWSSAVKVAKQILIKMTLCNSIQYMGLVDGSSSIQYKFSQRFY